MKLKIKLILALVAIVTILSFIGMYKHYKSEAKRMKSNQSVLLSEVDRYKVRDSLNVISIGELQFKNGELREFRADDAQMIKDLGIKLKRAKSIQNTVTKTEIKVVTELKDSLIYLDGRIDTISCLEYKNAYVDFSGCIISDSLRANIAIKDTLVQVIHRVPRRFLFFKYGTKAIKQEIVSKNPYTNLVYSEFINLE